MIKVDVRVANENDFRFAKEICEIISYSVKIKGVGIQRHSVQYIKDKMLNRNAIIATYNNRFLGFCCIEVYAHKEYLGHSGLVVHPRYRNLGIAKRIKKFALDYSLKKYPEAKVFGITTDLAVMNINSGLGYKPVTFSELTKASDFWESCKSCVHHNILIAKKCKMCLCTGMLFDPRKVKNRKENNNVQEELLQM